MRVDRNVCLFHGTLQAVHGTLHCELPLEAVHGTLQGPVLFLQIVAHGLSHGPRTECFLQVTQLCLKLLCHVCLVLPQLFHIVI
jgi:hypothetical protein